MSLGILSSRWTPAKLPGIFAWHDFGDPNSVLSSIGPDTPAANNAQVRRVLNQIDPSIRSLDQTTGADQPLYRHGAVNSRNAIEGDGSTDFLAGAFVEIFRNQSAGTILAVLRDLNPSGGFSNHTPATANTPTSGATRLRITTRTAESGIFSGGGRRLDADSLVNSVTDSSDDGVHLMESRADWANGQAQLLLDGQAQSAAAYSSGAGNTSDTDSVAVFSPVSNFPGYLCEVVWLRSILAADERAQVLAYSRAKWGTP